MRRIPTFVIAVGAAVAAVLGLALAAHAGGPTSVLITSPGHAAAALYYTDREYAELERLVSEQADTVPAPSSLGQGLQGYNLTWLVHDQLIWRTDRVYDDGSRIYVETTMVGAIMEPESGDTTTWHLVSGKAVERLVGLLGVVLDRGAGGPAASADPAVSTTPAPAVTGPEPEPTWFALTGWVWALPGLAVGAVAGALLGRWRTSPSAEPRRVLVDGDSVAV